MRETKGEQGFTLIELLVAILVSTIVFGNLITVLLRSTSHYQDRQIINRTEERARVVLDLLAYELRLLGSGMPLGQEDFDIIDTTLGTAVLPLSLASSTTHVLFRINETGVRSMLVAAFDPGLGTDFVVASATDFSVGDMIYISNMVVGEDDGLQGVITAISGTTVTIDGTFVGTPAATFAVGSSVNKVSTITLDNLAGIRRNDGSGAVPLLPEGNFTISYLDSAGAAITPPLSRTQVRQDLSAILISVDAVGERPLKNGTVYTATVRQEVNLRNLRMSRL